MDVYSFPAASDPRMADTSPHPTLAGRVSDVTGRVNDVTGRVSDVTGPVPTDGASVNQH